MTDNKQTSMEQKIDLLSSKPKKVHREVVRIETTYWKDRRGIHVKKSLMQQKRLSEGHQLFNEQFDDGEEFEVGRIENLDTVKDGLYEIVAINIETDWQTGYFEGCDYKLVPFITPKENK